MGGNGLAQAGRPASRLNISQDMYAYIRTYGFVLLREKGVGRSLRRRPHSISFFLFFLSVFGQSKAEECNAKRAIDRPNELGCARKCNE